MNYKKHYDLLINRGKNRVLDGYVERHHIIPQCMGGGDERDNLVQLTPEEHYVAHQLLLKIYPDVVGLASATQLMTVHHTDSRTTNKLFGWIRKKCAIDASIKMIKWHEDNEHSRGFLGKNHTSDIKNQIAKTTKESKIESVGIRVYAYNLDGTFYKEFRTLTECAEYLGSTPINVSMTAQGHHGYCKGKQLRFEYYDSIEPYVKPKIKTYKRTDDHKKNASDRFMKMSTCEYCGFTARQTNISRWHNEKCKHKNKDKS